MANAINVIFPYLCEGMWVFDDDRVGLDREPFVGGADTIIEQALALKGIKDGERGFRLVFSATPFPGHDARFMWQREADGGNYYWSDDFQIEGWLCPVLFRYFDTVPPEIHARFESKWARARFADHEPSSARSDRPPPATSAADQG